MPVCYITLSENSPKLNTRQMQQVRKIIAKGLDSNSRKLDENLKNQDLGMLYEKAKKKEKMPKIEREKLVKELTKKMHEAAKRLDFEEAARLRDEIAKMRSL